MVVFSMVSSVMRITVGSIPDALRPELPGPPQKMMRRPRRKDAPWNPV
jgi:hypothetical protein